MSKRRSERRGDTRTEDRSLARSFSSKENDYASNDETSKDRQCANFFSSSFFPPYPFSSSSFSGGLFRTRRSAVVCASGTGKVPAVVNAAAASPPAPEWKGANLKNLGLAVAVGIAIWFCPTPAGITAQAWHLLAIFVATIIGIITAPLPLGAVAMIGLCASMMTKTLTFGQAFAAFSNQIP